MGWKQYRVKALALLGIGLVLKLGIAHISELLGERYERQQRAEEEVRRMAGGAQVIEGPVVVIGRGESEDLRTGMPIVPLKRVSIDAKVDTEERYRGSYAYETFLSTVVIKGELEIPPHLLQSGEQAAEHSQVQSNGFLLLRVSGRQFIQSVDTVTLDGKPLTVARSHRPDTLAFLIPSLGFSSSGGGHALEVILRVRGTEGISFSPVSHAYTLSMRSNSSNPSFTGSILPTERKIDRAGSAAQWQGDSFSTSLSCYPDCSSVDQFITDNSSPIGAVFLSSLSVHTMVERTIKYRVLFVVLTFGAFLLFEILTKVRIHPIQYLLVGAALTVYYLLLLSLVEQVGFLAAYGVAAGVTTCLIAGYSMAILQNRRQGAVVGALLVGTYGFLYTVLQEQDAALLFGSMGLTALLGVFMFATRRIDWYSLMPTVPAEGVGSVDDGGAGNHGPSGDVCSIGK